MFQSMALILVILAAHIGLRRVGEKLRQVNYSDKKMEILRKQEREEWIPEVIQGGKK